MSMVSGGAHCKLAHCGVKIFSDVGTDLNAGEDMNCVMVPRRGEFSVGGRQKEEDDSD